MEKASPIAALASEVGNGQCGCSQLTQMQNHPGANKRPVSQRFDLVPSRPCHLSVRSFSLSVMITLLPSLLPFGVCRLKTASCLIILEKEAVIHEAVIVNAIRLVRT